MACPGIRFIVENGSKALCMLANCSKGVDAMDEEFAFLMAMLPEGEDDPWQTYPYFLCGVAGHACYLAWLFVFLATPDFRIMEEVNAGFSVLCHVLFLVGFVLLLVVGWAFSNALSTRRGAIALLIASFLLGACAPCVSLAQTAPGVVAASWVLSGAGGGCLLLLAAPFLSSLRHKRMVLFVALGLAAGSLLFMGIIYLAPFAKPCALIVVAGLSAGFSLSTHHLIRKNIPFVSSSESKERSCVSWKSSAAVLGNSICVGFMLYCVSLAIDMEWRYGVVGFAAIAAAVVMAMDVYHGERLNEETQLKLFLPGVVCGFFPMLFFGSWGILLGCVALVLVFSMQFITNLGAVAENVYLFKLSAVRSFSAWRLWNLAGMMAGYVAGFAAFGLIGRDGDDASTSVLFALLALLVVLATFFYQNRYPSLMPERVEDKREESQRGKWMAKCERFAASNDLSPREKEILVMLAKGHDTDFIQEKLFISKSTIKSHTYNIYKKAGVHSRKELMNLIKEVELPSDSPKRSKSIKSVSVHA